MQSAIGKGTEKKVFFFFPRGSAVRKLRKLRLVCFELLRVLKQNLRGKKLQNVLVEDKVNFYVKSIERRYLF